MKIAMLPKLYNQEKYETDPKEKIYKKEKGLFPTKGELKSKSETCGGYES